MSGLVILLVTGVALYAQRASFIVPSGRWVMPARWEAVLVHARPAVLGALLASVLVDRGGAPDLGALAVAAVAFAAAGRLGFLGTTVVGIAAIGALALA